MDLESARQNYETAGLDKADVAPNPMDQFSAWFEEVRTSGYFEPEAMIVTTVGLDGKPSARTVLCRGFDHQGFRFFTNYDSAKGREIGAQPEAVVLFSWVAVRRQVRATGGVERLSALENDRYFATRPRGSQLSAWASPQSEVIDSRAVLDAGYEKADQRFAGETVARPPHWGGYRLVPDAVEFWQGQPERLHDRLRYRLEHGSWTIERLAP